MKLKEKRLEKEIKQKDLAEAIGTNEAMLSRFENYKCLPTPPMMDSLTKELGCEISDIYEDNEVFYKKKKVGGKKKEKGVYKLTVRLPIEVRDLLEKALPKCGYRNITAWIDRCVERLKKQYEYICAAEEKKKKDSTPTDQSSVKSNEQKKRHK